MSETKLLGGDKIVDDDIKVNLDGIQKTYGDKCVISDITLHVNAAEHVCVLGPSGCGKSTLMNILTGLLDCDKGKVRVEGRIGYMQQKDLLLPWKSCIENVYLPLILAGEAKEKARSRAASFFDTFKISGCEDKYPQEMSGGMRQRAALLRTFLSSEDILLLDEPFGALDSITRGQLHTWLIDVEKEYLLTTLMITHDIDEAILLSDRIYVLSNKPAHICDEIIVDYLKDDKNKRLFDARSLEIKKRILDDLKEE